MINKIIRLLVCIVLAAHMSLGCAAHALHPGEPGRTLSEEAGQGASFHRLPDEGVDGMAVYYARRFQGRRTNSGDIFDHDKLTAAHPSLPYGIIIRKAVTSFLRSRDLGALQGGVRRSRDNMPNNA